MSIRWLVVGVIIGWVSLCESMAQMRVCSSCDYTTVAEGIEASHPFDTLYIANGRYQEFDLKVEKPLTIIGEENTIIDGNKEGTILHIFSDEVHISDLKLIHVGLSHTVEYSAVHLLEVDGFSLMNITVEDAFFGFHIERSRNGLITGNTLSGESEEEFYSGNGIHAWNSSELTITNNLIRNLRDAIYLEFVDNTLVKNNVSENNIRYGLHFMFSDHNSYRQNIFRGNGAGVAVMFSKFIEMTENRFEDNWGTASFGLLLKEIYDANITGNRFKNNTIGISVEGSSRLTYSDNSFTRNGWAVRMSGGCYTNSFENNSFANNSFDLSFNSKLNDNSFDGNYWSSYRGYDLNKDGIGDVPHRPVKLFSYVVNRTPETMILLRSLFVDLINFSENVTPVFTPVELMDKNPLMKEHNDRI